ncbi:hypothetical protein NDA11_006203 [Ustilago hordei]|nr:hypothetical protein NDA11_006203 [Ustilago hordei]KAJ1601147.1 hypothetical protein NDA14_007538 [Ustilago hordei]
MLHYLGRLFLVAALAVACLRPATQNRPLRRAIVGDNNDNYITKLHRRWYFLWPGSLAPKPPREGEEHKIIYADWIVHHDPAYNSNVQKEIELARLQNPTFIQVSVGESSSSSSSSSKKS